MVNDPRCPTPATPVHIVGDDTRPGVPVGTVQQWAIKHGIFRKIDPSLRGQLVEEFGATFELTEVLRPVERELFSDAAAAAVSTSTITRIDGVRDQIRVIRALSLQVNTQIPDSIQVQLNARSGIATGIWLEQFGLFPANGLVIGDMSSPLTAHFARQLPLTLYPADAIIFKVNKTPAGNWDSLLTAWIETYPLPLRPAGL